MKKIIKILLLFICILILMQGIIFADESIDTDYEIGKNSQIFDSTGKITGRIVGTLQVVGSVLSIVALIIIGIRYLMSSVDEQAKLKGIIIYYIIGAMLVFATSNILSIVYKIINGISY